MYLNCRDHLENHDCIVVGSGEAGKLIAWYLSNKYKQQCTVTERYRIGGSNPDAACLPSKVLLHSAAVAHDARQHGYAPNSFKADMKAVRRRAADLVGHVNGVQGAYGHFCTESVNGDAKLDTNRSVRVALSDGGKRWMTAKCFVVCTGSRPFIDKRILGLVDANPMTHVAALDLETLPDHLIVIGGGYTGLEYAQAFRRFGSEVTVIEHQSQVMAGADSESVGNPGHALAARAYGS